MGEDRPDPSGGTRCLAVIFGQEVGRFNTQHQLVHNQHELRPNPLVTPGERNLFEAAVLLLDPAGVGRGDFAPSSLATGHPGNSFRTTPLEWGKKISPPGVVEPKPLRPGVLSEADVQQFNCSSAVLSIGEPVGEIV